MRTTIREPDPDRVAQREVVAASVGRTIHQPKIIAALVGAVLFFGVVAATCVSNSKSTGAETPGHDDGQERTLPSTTALRDADDAARGRAQREAEERQSAQRAAAEAAQLQEANRAAARVDHLVKLAKDALEMGGVEMARSRLQEALALDLAQNRERAREVLQIIKNADDPDWALAVLIQLPQSEFDQFQTKRITPKSLDLSYPALTRRAVANARSRIDEAAIGRAELREREREAAEAAKKARAEARRRSQAEADDRRKAQDAKAAAEAEALHREAVAKARREAEAKRRAEQEYDVEGLVLLRDTVKARREKYGGGTLTGMITNRRGHTLRYAKITFSLFDKRGVRVGTAFDIISNLGPGEVWKFSASSLGTEFSTYKIAELTGD